MGNLLMAQEKGLRRSKSKPFSDFLYLLSSYISNSFVISLSDNMYFDGNALKSAAATLFKMLSVKVLAPSLSLSVNPATASGESGTADATGDTTIDGTSDVTFETTFGGTPGPPVVGLVHATSDVTSETTTVPTGDATGVTYLPFLSIYIPENVVFDGSVTVLPGLPNRPCKRSVCDKTTVPVSTTASTATIIILFLDISVG